ncbi:MAG TPA: exodeoxyribonuclease III [Luteibaculaceae bacterium]|nr:exodeoxyribonuclease III [Luteibaculaceae bacterium]
MKIISWNLNGIRAVAAKGLLDIIENFQADVVCFQETKATPEQVREVLFPLTNYEIFAHSGEKKGYSGTAILTKIKPMQVTYGMGIAEHDNEGRLITMEFESFYLINTYVPNSGSELIRLPYRQQWDLAMSQYIAKLEKNKPVVWCGDLNVAHKPIDLKNDKANYNKTAGYMQEEIDGMDRFIAQGMIDTFRFFHPTTEKYSWWSYRAGAREKNIGWRIDYFLTSAHLKDRIQAADILNDVMGSDHCPVSLVISE